MCAPKTFDAAIDFKSAPEMSYCCQFAFGKSETYSTLSKPFQNINGKWKNVDTRELAVNDSGTDNDMTVYFVREP